TPVTATDRESEARIRGVLNARFPGKAFLGEESYHGSEPPRPLARGDRWIVDPLDGTKKFVRGLPFFGPCVALESDGQIQAGVIDLPALSETFWGERGGGAFRNGEAIRVSTQDRLDRAYVVYSNEPEFYRRGWGPSLEKLILGTYHNPG